MEQSDLGPYCLQNRLPKNILKQIREQTTIVMNGGKQSDLSPYCLQYRLCKYICI